MGKCVMHDGHSHMRVRVLASMILANCMALRRKIVVAVDRIDRFDLAAGIHNFRPAVPSEVVEEVCYSQNLSDMAIAEHSGMVLLTHRADSEEAATEKVSWHRVVEMFAHMEVGSDYQERRQDIVGRVGQPCCAKLMVSQRS